MIVLWTKADDLDDDKAIQLMKDGNLSVSEAKQQALKTAWADFEKNINSWFAEFKYQLLDMWHTWHETRPI